MSKIQQFSFNFLQVDVFVSRDLDSRLNDREFSAVKEWREVSNLSIHSMRDHPYHGVALLGASWGTDLTRKVFGNRVSARQAWKESWKYILQDYLTYSKRESWGPDQIILTKYFLRFLFKILPLTYIVIY